MRVTLNFHPDRPAGGGLTLDRLAAEVAYRSQFVGSAHFRLAATALPRTTFCYPDSVLEPSDFGVAPALGLIELALADHSDDLDDYIEAQVHGPVRLDADVEALVLDPSHRGTAVAAAAARLPCPVEWHSGFRLAVGELRRHPGYRGLEFVRLGADIAVDGHLDPAIIGTAARTGRYDPQALKRVWHYVARFGPPPGPPIGPSAAEPGTPPAEPGPPTAI
jgi:hypothetical protein